MIKYTVQFFQDNIYEVLITDNEIDWRVSKQVFLGSLADCEAYVRLKQNEDVAF